MAADRRFLRSSNAHALQGERPVPYQALADTLLLLHFGVVLFVVLGLPVILLGNAFGWSWVNDRWWRLAHLAAIAVVVVQAWLGQYCALTDLESWLRQHAGQVAYERSFIEHWVQRVLYYQAPMWAFSLAYTGFGILVALAWRRFPPRAGSGRNRDALK